MNRTTFILLLLIVLASCKRNHESQESNHGVVMDLPELSIYNLPSTWLNQNNEQVSLSDYRGKSLAVVMIYTSCKAACPRLVADMHSIDDQIPQELKDSVRLILVSIDPETDTPDRLKDFSMENNMVDPRWVLLTGTEEDTREFASVLAVNYREISPLNFSHSNIISVFDKSGVLQHQQEGLGVDNKETVDRLLFYASTN